MSRILDKTHIDIFGGNDEGVGRFGDCWWALTLTQVYSRNLPNN